MTARNGTAALGTAVLPSRSGAASDDRLVARRIADGDRASFEALMRRHNRRLYRLARAVLRDDAEAEDALQDAYLSAYRSIGQFRGDATLSTWLARMVLNECYARRRKTMRRHTVAPMAAADDVDAIAGDERDSPERALGRAQVRALIERRVDALPEDFRTVFVLRTVEELSVEETALCLGIPEATVRSRLFRARSLLRKTISRDLDTAECTLYEFGGADCDRIVAAVLSRVADH